MRSDVLCGYLTVPRYALRRSPSVRLLEAYTMQSAGQTLRHHACSERRVETTIYAAQLDNPC
jgi:hypothetical protein